MSHHTAADFTPWGSASSALYPRPPKRVPKADAVANARPALAEGASVASTADAELSIAWPVRALRWTRGLAHRISARNDGDTMDELYAYARKVEHEMPNLAAELRFIASHRPDAPD